jgi:hypothetical protein
LRARAVTIGSTTGVSIIEAAQLGRRQAALSALQSLRDEPLVLSAEVYLSTGQKLASYTQATDQALLQSVQPYEPQAASPSPSRPGVAKPGPPTCRFDPSRVQLILHGRRFEISVPARRDGVILGYTNMSLPLAALYPDWRGYAAITAAAAAGAVLISYWLAARCRANFESHRQPWRRPCSAYRPRRTTDCGLREVPRMRSAR